MLRATLREEMDHLSEITGLNEVHPMDAAEEAIYWIVEAFSEDSAKIKVPLKERTAVEFRDFIMRQTNGLKDSH